MILNPFSFSNICPFLRLIKYVEAMDKWKGEKVVKNRIIAMKSQLHWVPSTKLKVQLKEVSHFLSL